MIVKCLQTDDSLLHVGVYWKSLATQVMVNIYGDTEIPGREFGTLITMIVSSETSASLYTTMWYHTPKAAIFILRQCLALGHDRQFLHHFHSLFTNKSAFNNEQTGHHAIKMKNNHQQNATYYFIVLLIGSTCFGHYDAHHQELATIMLITTLVVSFLVCCRLDVRCGYAGVVSGLEVAV